MVQMMEGVQVLGGLGVLEAQGSLVGTAEMGLAASDFYLPKRPFDGYLPVICLKTQEQAQVWQRHVVFSLAQARSNVGLSLDLRCLNQLVLGSSSNCNWSDL